MPGKTTGTTYKKGVKNYTTEQYGDKGESLAKQSEELAALYEKAMQTRKERNRQNRLDGRLFEESIDRACEAYRAAGRCMVVKVPEARRVIGRTGNRSSAMICVNAKKAHPDYMGSVSPEGKTIVFDAKHTGSGKLAYTALSEHQREIMDAHERCGAECYVMASFGGDDCFLIPYDFWKNMAAKVGRKSILPIDRSIQEYRVPVTYIVNKKKEEVPVVWFLGDVAELPGEGEEDDPFDFD